MRCAHTACCHSGSPSTPLSWHVCGVVILQEHYNSCQPWRSALISLQFVVCIADRSGDCEVFWDQLPPAYCTMHTQILILPYQPLFRSSICCVRLLIIRTSTVFSGQEEARRLNTSRLLPDVVTYTTLLRVWAHPTLLWFFDNHQVRFAGEGCIKLEVVSRISNCKLFAT